MSPEPPNEEPPPPVLAGGPPLIFDWQPVRWRKTRLMVALAAAAAGHVLVFYLFQVVSGSSPRQAPPVREALILTGTGESTRRLLESAEDRFPALSPPVALEDSGTSALAALVKGYVPTWQDHRPSLKALPGRDGAGALPAMTGHAEAMLPPLPASPDVVNAEMPVPAAHFSRPGPELGFQSGLSAGDLIGKPVWPAAVLQADWPEEGPASFMLSVDPAGKVTSCLSLGAPASLGDEEVETLRSVLLKLRFAGRRDASGPRWGWVDVLW